VEEVTSGFRAFVARTFGDEGRRWLADLPALREEIAARWQLELGTELRGGHLAYVCEAVTADGVEAVAKLGPPWMGTEHEASALEIWGGVGAPALLRHDAGLHALLLERIRPGCHPSPGSADDVARLLDMIHVRPPSGLPTLGEAVRRRLSWAAEQGRASREKLSWAMDAVVRLEESPPAAVLLHGDFDDRNLLACARRGLCAIDPLPCAGDPCYDAATWIHANRRPGRRARLDALLEATGLPRARVRDWAGVIGVHG
jgi:streptomycin 6-kinase